MPAHNPIQLIVGLGNPGEKYAHTRHNVGAWYVEKLAAEWGLKLHQESKFQGRIASFEVAGHKGWLLLPSTYMNASGQSVRAITQFFHIPAETVLVIHDELDFTPGTIRLKEQGGHGGHNGLRDIIQHLKTDHFLRLRIGIGHPGHRDAVHDYVLSNPSKDDKSLIIQAIEQSFALIPELLKGDIQKAMQILHS